MPPLSCAHRHRPRHPASRPQSGPAGGRGPGWPPAFCRAPRAGKWHVPCLLAVHTDRRLPMVQRERFAYPDHWMQNRTWRRRRPSLADPTRMVVLDEIAARGPQRVGALARAAGVRPPVASHRVSRLTPGGLVVPVPASGMRVVSLASDRVAEALEALSRSAPPRRVEGLRAAGRAEACRVARSCRDHLAGAVAVGLFACMREAGSLLVGDAPSTLKLSVEGERTFAALDLDIASLHRRRRAFARECTWTAPGTGRIWPDPWARCCSTAWQVAAGPGTARAARSPLATAPEAAFRRGSGAIPLQRIAGRQGRPRRGRRETAAPSA